jgi:hypothetical protein
MKAMALDSASFRGDGQRAAVRSQGWIGKTARPWLHPGTVDNFLSIKLAVYEDEPTKFRTMEEAKVGLAKLEQEQAALREFLGRSCY